MQALLSLLIVAIVPGAPIDARYPEAVEVFSCGFEEEADLNYDGWPDGWTRRLGPGLPHYVEAQIERQGAAQGAAALRVKLDGGGAVLVSPPVPVSALASYVLEARLKPDALVHDEAFVAITFLDDQRRVLHTHRSAGVDGSGDWRKVRLGPIAAASPAARYGVVELHVEPREKEDLRGGAWFDDLWLARLPRLAVETNHRWNLFTRPGDVQIAAHVSDFAPRQPQVVFELFDALGNRVREGKRQVPRSATKERNPAAGEGGAGPDEPAGERVSVAWEPGLDQPGFYRLVAELRDGGATLVRQEIALAVIEPAPPAAEFGWSFPAGAGPLPRDALIELLAIAGVGRVKFPLWYGESQTEGAADSGTELGRLVERLAARQVEVIGLLAEPPEALRAKLGGKRRLPAAEIFAAPPEVWQPALEPVLTRFAVQVRCWQIGHDHDASLLAARDGPAKVAQIRAQWERIGQQVQLGVGGGSPAAVDGSGASAEPIPASSAPRPWQFVAMSPDVPLTLAELRALRGSPGAAAMPLRWPTIRALERSSATTEDRAADLVARLVAARQHGLAPLFFFQPLDTSQGLLNDDGTPGELLPVWATAVSWLGEREYLGSLRLAGGSENCVFCRGDDAVIVVWNPSPKREKASAGPQARQFDAWGRKRAASGVEREMELDVGPVPSFVTGVPAELVRSQLACRLERERVPSVVGEAHLNRLLFTNHFAVPAAGRIRLMAPPRWQIRPAQLDFSLAPGETLQADVQMRLPYHVTGGEHLLTADVDLLADERHQFRVYRPIQVGLGEIVLEVSTRLDAGGELIVEQRLRNESDEPASFKCDLHAPNRRRMRTQVFQLGRGEDVQRYRLPGGKELIGQSLSIRVEEVGGNRSFTRQFQATP